MHDAKCTLNAPREKKEVIHLSHDDLVHSPIFVNARGMCQHDNFILCKANQGIFWYPVPQAELSDSSRVRFGHKLQSAGYSPSRELQLSCVSYVGII